MALGLDEEHDDMPILDSLRRSISDVLGDLGVGRSEAHDFGHGYLGSGVVGDEGGDGEAERERCQGEEDVGCGAVVLVAVSQCRKFPPEP